MLRYFSIENGKLKESKDSTSPIRVFSNPDNKERLAFMKQLEVDNYDFEAALDPDEISRVEFEHDLTTIIWKQPHTEEFSLKAQFDVNSVGFFIHNGTLSLILSKDDIPFDSKVFDGVYSIYDVLLGYFFYTIRQFASHLKAIKRAKSKLEGKLSQSMENRYFLQMFDISESLVYYIDAIEANGAVLGKLLARTNRSNGDKLQLTEAQIDYLEDTIQENTQIARQAQIYSTVLSGLMDARGNIINNNMNVLLKNLTLINVVFLPLNLIASMGGMSEYSMMIGDYRINWRVGYFVFTIAMAVMAWALWIVLKKYVVRPIQED